MVALATELLYCFGVCAELYEVRTYVRTSFLLDSNSGLFDSDLAVQVSQMNHAPGGVDLKKCYNNRVM